MRIVTTAALAGLFTTAASATMAADLPRPILPPAPVIKDTSEGWYLRGDIGAITYDQPKAFSAASPLGSGAMTGEYIGSSAVAGAGIGYRFSPNFRADVTVDHRFDSRFKGMAGVSSQDPDTGETSTLAWGDRGRFESTTLMLNGYVDLGTVGGLTPYIGAGIGVAHNILAGNSRIGTIYTTSIDPDTGDAITGMTNGSMRLLSGSHYSFAWALMAGVGYQLSSNFTLDLGYRYASLGDVKTRGYDAGNGTSVKSIASHELRVGLRYAFR